MKKLKVITTFLGAVLGKNGIRVLKSGLNYVLSLDYSQFSAGVPSPSALTLVYDSATGQFFMVPVSTRTSSYAPTYPYFGF